MRKSLLAAALAVTAVACDREPTQGPATEMQRTADNVPPARAETAPTAKTWNDSQIVGTLTAINQGEVDIANAALPKLGNRDVKDYATMMAKMHSEGVQKLSAVATEQHITPVDNNTTTKLKSDASTLTAKMSADAAGPTYDRAYMQAQVDGHQQALKTIDETLLPNADNASLKETITTMRGVVMTHLSKAQSILHGLPAS